MKMTLEDSRLLDELRQFDESCLSVPSEIDPQQIKTIREQNQVSQPVFARFLPEYQRIDRSEMGGGSKAPQRHGAQTVGSGAEARIEGVGLNEACAIIFVPRSVTPAHRLKLAGKRDARPTGRG